MTVTGRIPDRKGTPRQIRRRIVPHGFGAALWFAFAPVAYIGLALPAAAVYADYRSRCDVGYHEGVKRGESN